MAWMSALEKGGFVYDILRCWKARGVCTSLFVSVMTCFSNGCNGFILSLDGPRIGSGSREGCENMGEVRFRVEPLKVRMP